TKANLLFTIESAMLAVLAALVPLADCWTVEARVCSLVAGAALVVSVLFLVAAAFPRLTGPRGSAIYFGGIAAAAADSYVEKMIKGVNEDIIKDFASQCHRNAQIAEKKYRMVQRATIGAFLALPFWLGALWNLYPLKYASTAG